MIDKKSLRREFRELRRNMERYDKKHADSEIARRFLESEEYRQHDTILCYVSSEIEVDTYVIIDSALSHGKNVYVPKCQSGNEMKFYRIYSFNDLHKGAYGIMEPDADAQEYFGDPALCAVPGLSFDISGNRLGFGMGFYDRFLSENPQLCSVGLCYQSCIMDKLPAQEHDVCVRKIITEVKTIDIEV